MEKIAEGAEAQLFRDNNNIIKKRIEKCYRHPIIDHKLRKQRTNREAKVLEKLESLNILAPKLFSKNETEIIMQYIDGEKLRDCINDNISSFAQQVGEGIAQMHNANIIHGDLTTSNLIVSSGKIFFIDFGLSLFSSKVEDKAVDLHILRECIESHHPEYLDIFFNLVLKTYSLNNSNSKEVLDRFIIVEQRGRNKQKS